MIHDEPVDSLPSAFLVRPGEPGTTGEQPPTRAPHRVRRWVGGSILGIGLIVLVVSSLSLVSQWKADQRTVHSLRNPGVHQVRLDARAYQIYSVATAGGAVATRCFSVTGAAGQVKVQSHSYQLSPYDPANVILRTGTFFPAADFVVASGGVYAISDRCLAPGQKIFVAEAQVAALHHVASGLGGVAAALAVVIVALVVLRGAVTRRRPSRVVTVVATTPIT